MKKLVALLLTLALACCSVLPAMGEEILETLSQQILGCWLLEGVIRAGKDIELPEELWDFTGLEFRDDWTVLMPFSKEPDLPRPYSIVDEYTLTIGEDYYSFQIEINEEEGDRLTIWVDYPQEPSVTLVYGRVDGFPALTEDAGSAEAPPEEAALTLEDILGDWVWIGLSDDGDELFSTDDMVELMGFGGDADATVHMAFSADGVISVYTDDAEAARDGAEFTLEGENLIIADGSEIASVCPVSIREGRLWLKTPAVYLVFSRPETGGAPEKPAAAADAGTGTDAGALRTRLIGRWMVARFEGPANFTAPRAFAEQLGVKDAVMQVFAFTEDGVLVILSESDDGAAAELTLGYGLEGDLLTILDGAGGVLHTGRISFTEAELAIEATEGMTLILRPEVKE